MQGANSWAVGIENLEGKCLINRVRNLLLSALLLASFGNLTRTYASIVTYSFSGLMQGNEIFAMNTKFVGSFTYELAQNFNASGSYLLQSYEITFLSDPLPIPPVVGYSGLGGGLIYPSITGTSWNGAFPNNLYPSISVSNSANDVFFVSFTRLYTMGFRLGELFVGGPSFTFTDSTGSVFSDTSLPDLSLVGSRFNSGQINIGYAIDGGSSASQTGIISVPEPSSLSLLMAGGAVLMAGRRRK